MIKYRSGIPIDVDPQVIRWRKQMRRFRRFKKLIITQVLAWHNGDVDRAEAFLKAPNTDLGGMAPRQFFNPRQIRKLWQWVSRAK